MTNTNETGIALIGRLAEKLTQLEELGKAGTAEYATIQAEYLRVKALPENWMHVRASRRTPEQAALAAADEASGA